MLARTLTLMVALAMTAGRTVAISDLGLRAAAA